MKITRRQLKHIIKEQLGYINEDYEGPFDGEPLTMRFEFERGESATDFNPRVTPISSTFPDHEVIAIALQKAITSDQEGYNPIKIVAGTSGTGTDDQNKAVLDKRIDAAFDYLNEVIKNEPIFGPRGYRYDPVTIKNLAEISYEIDLMDTDKRIEIPPGSGKYIRAPSDPDSQAFWQYQFVEITLTDPGIAADPVALANAFVEATLRTKGPVYADTPAGRLTVSDDVVDILSQIRTASEFEKFNTTIIKLNRSKKDFYSIAATATFNVPKWVPGLGGKSYGPQEIPVGVAAINSHLVRLGQRKLG